MAASKVVQSDAIQHTTASFPFDKLPVEIRLLMWEEALLEESSGRLIILDHSTHRVLPFKSLVSPMLTINKESRSCALNFFTIKLTVCKLPGPNHPTINVKGSFDFNEVNEAPNSKKRLYLSSQHDTFIAGLDLVPTEDAWYLTHAICNNCHDDVEHMFYCCGRQYRLGNFLSPAKYYTSEVHSFRPRIERVVSLFADGLCSPYSTPDYCSCQPRSYEEDIASRFWSKHLFPGIKQYFYYPWGHKTSTLVGELLEHLFQRRPVDLLPAEYRMKELVWSEYVEAVSGEGEEEIIRKNILVDPLLEDRRPCRCMLKGIVSDEFYERAGLTISELRERMHREAVRSP
ncbi:hypothetical protein F5Y06DRAFT_306777 [Hypoxylon sp. FL0890]|nr:hypothetical protein F5Y06DRAFT_306777 [Hypoxylon sp. FL0890]